MTTSAAPRHAWVDVYDLEETVTIHVPGERATVRLLTTPRDTDEAPITERISFAVLGSLPEEPLGSSRVRIDPARLNDALQQRFDRFAAGGPPGRHRAPGLLARLFGLGGAR